MQFRERNTAWGTYWTNNCARNAVSFSHLLQLNQSVQLGRYLSWDMGLWTLFPSAKWDSSEKYREHAKCIETSLTNLIQILSIHITLRPSQWHDDAMKWNIFRVTGHCAGNSPIPVNSPHKGQWRGALMFSLICVWINDWVNNSEAGDLTRHRAHYDVTVMEASSEHGSGGVNKSMHFIASFQGANIYLFT